MTFSQRFSRKRKACFRGRPRERVAVDAEPDVGVHGIDAHALRGLRLGLLLRRSRNLSGARTRGERRNGNG